MIKLLSRVPMWALYAFSGFLYFLAYYVVRHRHHVIREQLAQVFPDAVGGRAHRHPQALSQEFLRCHGGGAEIRVAARRREMSARIRILNLPAARSYLDAGQSVMFVTSHLCNWEWLLQGVTLQLGYPVDAAYKPLHDAVGRALDARGSLALRRAADSRQGAAGGFSAPPRASCARWP